MVLHDDADAHRGRLRGVSSARPDSLSDACDFPATRRGVDCGSDGYPADCRCRCAGAQSVLVVLPELEHALWTALDVPCRRSLVRVWRRAHRLAADTSVRL